MAATIHPRFRPGHVAGARNRRVRIPVDQEGRAGRLGAEVLAVSLPVCHRLLRDGVHGGELDAVRYRPLRRCAAAIFAAAVRSAHGRRHAYAQAGADPAQGLRADVRAQVGDGLRSVRHQRRVLPELRDAAGIDKIIPVDIYVPGVRRDRRRLSTASCGCRTASRVRSIRSSPISSEHGDGLRRVRQAFGAGCWEANMSHGTLVLRFAPPTASARSRDSSPSSASTCCSTSRRSTGQGSTPRFDVVYHFYSTAHHVRVRLKMRVAQDEPTVDSLVSLYGSAHFMERECHDMYGIVFRGNPDLRPILLYEGFVGHPLRKDYPKRRSSRSCPIEHDGRPWTCRCPTPSAPRSTRRPRRCRHRQYRSVASRHARDDPGHRRARRREGEARRRPLRIPAPRVREGVRVAYLAQPDPLRQPAQLLLRADQRLCVLRGCRDADGYRDHASLPLPADAAFRIFAHRGSPDLRRGHADGDRAR